jgi:hypothetical protein
MSTGARKWGTVEDVHWFNQYTSTRKYASGGGREKRRLKLKLRVRPFKVAIVTVSSTINEINTCFVITCATRTE